MSKMINLSKSNRKYIAMVLLELFVITGCTQINNFWQQVTPTSAAIDPQMESAIYYRILSEVIGPQPVYVIEVESQDLCYSTDGIQKLLPELQKDTKENFDRQQNNRQNLSEIIHPNENIFFVNEKDYQVESTEENPCSVEKCFSLDALKTDYPNAWGIIRLSNIGFSDDREQALVCAEIFEGGVSGTVHVILLRKENQEWKIEKQYDLFWIS